MDTFRETRLWHSAVILLAAFAVAAAGMFAVSQIVNPAPAVAGQTVTESTGSYACPAGQRVKIELRIKHVLNTTMHVNGTEIRYKYGNVWYGLTGSNRLHDGTPDWQSVRIYYTGRQSVQATYSRYNIPWWEYLEGWLNGGYNRLSCY